MARLGYKVVLAMAQDWQTDMHLILNAGSSAARAVELCILALLRGMRRSSSTLGIPGSAAI